MFQKLKIKLQKYLGIPELTTKITKLENRVDLLEADVANLNSLKSELKNQLIESKNTTEELIRRYENLYQVYLNVDKDNRNVLNHVEFINSHFTVAADISGHERDENTLIVLKKDKETIMKELILNPSETQYLYQIVSNFDKDRCYIDKPQGFPPVHFNFNKNRK